MKFHAGPSTPPLALEVRLHELREAEPRHVGARHQQRMAARGAGAADGPAVGAGRRPDLRIAARQEVVGEAGEAERQLQRDLAEVGQHVPRFELFDQPRPHVGMRVEVVVDPRDERRVEPLRRAIERREVALAARHDLERPIEQIRVEPLRAVDFAVAAEREDVGVLDLPEEVLGLDVAVAEDGRFVVVADDVGEAELVAVDGDPRGELAGGGEGVCFCGCGEAGNASTQRTQRAQRKMRISRVHFLCVLCICSESLSVICLNRQGRQESPRELQKSQFRNRR